MINRNDGRRSRIHCQASHEIMTRWRTCIVPISRLGGYTNPRLWHNYIYVMGGVPETPKDPPRNHPAGASPSPDWQRCLFSFFTMWSSSDSRITDFHSRNAGVSPAARPIFQLPQHGGRQLAQRGLQNLAGSGQHRDAVPIFPTNSGVAKWQGSGFIRRVSPVRIRPPQPATSN